MHGQISRRLPGPIGSSEGSKRRRRVAPQTETALTIPDIASERARPLDSAVRRLDPARRAIDPPRRSGDRL